MVAEVLVEINFNSKEQTFSYLIPSFINVLNGCNDILEYINLDDAYVNGFIKQLTKSNDHVLKTLATAFENRHLFKFVELANDPDPDFLDNLAKKYDNPNGKYYYKNTVVSQVAYSHSKKTDIMDIKVLLPDGSIKSLDKYSPIIKSLSLSSYKMIERIYYFEED